jgi:hypothetical protein
MPTSMIVAKYHISFLTIRKIKDKFIRYGTFNTMPHTGRKRKFKRAMMESLFFHAYNNPSGTIKDYVVWFEQTYHKKIGRWKVIEVLRRHGV